MTAPQCPAPARSLLDEMAAALERVRQACLFDDDNGRIGVTNEPHISNEQFNEVGLVLARYRAAKAAEPDLVAALKDALRHCPACSGTQIMNLYGGDETEIGCSPGSADRPCTYCNEWHAALAAAQAKEGRDE